MEIEKEGPRIISGAFITIISINTRRKAGENAAAKAEECQAKVFFIFYNFICHFSKLGPHSQLKFTSWAPPTMLLERNFFGSRALGRQPLIPSIGRLGQFLVNR